MRATRIEARLGMWDFKCRWLLRLLELMVRISAVGLVPRDDANTEMEVESRVCAL